ncbi:hypothetical protein PybrP1_009062, partial [[Pythium] brassicae (nom. inval.)]
MTSGVGNQADVFAERVMEIGVPIGRRKVGRHNARYCYELQPETHAAVRFRHAARLVFHVVRRCIVVRATFTLREGVERDRQYAGQRYRAAWRHGRESGGGRRREAERFSIIRASAAKKGIVESRRTRTADSTILSLHRHGKDALFVALRFALASIDRLVDQEMKPEKFADLQDKVYKLHEIYKAPSEYELEQARNSKKARRVAHMKKRRLNEDGGGRSGS